MGNKVTKGVLTLAVTGGVMFAGLGGCLGISTTTAWQAAAFYTGLSYVLDNDSVFDLFEDGNIDEDTDE